MLGEGGGGHAHEEFGLRRTQSPRLSKPVGQVRDSQSLVIRCAECIQPQESRMVPLLLESLGCGLCLSRFDSDLQPEWVQVYNPCR